MGLGRTEEKHIICQYEGREDECPKDCDKCAIAMKTDGDIALSAGNIDLAIKQYKKATFVDAKFAEAWNNLGNAYGMKSEQKNAIKAFNKAIGIDTKYGEALFGKAVALEKLGEVEEAMALANEILEIYDDEEVQIFKETLIKEGVKDRSNIFSLTKAIEKMTNEAERIINFRNLTDETGHIDTERSIYDKEGFASSIFKFCARRYASLGIEKVCGESILACFYGSLCATMMFYDDEENFSCDSPFLYLADHANLEELDRLAEKELGISGDEASSDKLWNIIYPFVTFCKDLVLKVEPKNDINAAIIDATESAYVIGMLYAKRHHEQDVIRANRSALNLALDKLAKSTKDYNYTPPDRSAMCYSIALPMTTQRPFICAKCGRNASFEVDEDDYGLISDYQELAGKFTKRGYPSNVECLCDRCAEKYYPSDSSYFKHNIIFSLHRPDRANPVISYPSSFRYNDFAYRVALAFLDGADTVKKLAEVTNTELAAETYINHIHEVLGDVIGEDE